MAWDNYISEHENTDIKIIRLEVDDYREWESDTDPDDLRNVEKSLVTIDQVAEYTDYRYKSVAVFDIRYETRMQAWLNMLKTVFVCIVLAVSSILFSNDANRLVLGPIESMITKVKKIAENPLAAV